MGEAVLGCSDLSREFAEKNSRLRVLSGINLSLSAGEQVAIQGPSGVGKTALLNLLAGLDRPTAGEVQIMGRTLSKMTEPALVQWRARHLGFVYQFSHLLSQLTTLENILLPQWIAGVNSAQAKRRASMLLEKVGLADRAEALAQHLSGGERQRAAVARAMACSPACLLMDEPTGSLDGGSSAIVRSLIRQLAGEEGIAVLLATHDEALAAAMDRRLTLQGGDLLPA